MSRKKLKAFDPGNSNKARRDAWEALQSGANKPHLNAAPRPGADSNKLTGAARRFATQLLISKKLDQRDRERNHQQSGKPSARAGGKGGGGGGNGSNYMLPDYKQALQDQINAHRERAAKQAAKDERRRLASEGGGGGAPGNSASAAAPAVAASPARPASAAGVVSLSKSVEQQRQDRAARKSDDAKRSTESAAKAATAGTAEDDGENEAGGDDAADPTSPSLADQGALSKPAASSVSFSTEMRPGESFRSFQARLVREKSEKMQLEVHRKTLNEKRKRKLAERDEKKKAKKDPGVDMAERQYIAEREAKEKADAARAALLKAGPPVKGKGKAAAAAAAVSDDDDDDGRPSKRPRSSGAKEFAVAAPPSFGDVAERPPTLTTLPKSKALPSGKLEADRILDSLLLMQEGKPAKRGGLKGLDQAAKDEWIAKQRDQLRREAAAQERQRQEMEDLRAQSVAAYKASKARRKEEEAEAAASGAGDDKPYVKKRVLKKQRRNRERLQQFKEQQELEADMEIEMAED